MALLYQPSMDEVRSGRREFVKLDVLHREMLDNTLAKFNVKGVPPDMLADLNLAWHRLDAWPDVPPGLPGSAPSSCSRRAPTAISR